MAINKAQPISIIKDLLAYGANPNLQSQSGRTALNDSRVTPQILQVLFAYGGDPNIPDRYGETGLMKMAKLCKTENAKILLENGSRS